MSGYQRDSIVTRTLPAATQQNPACGACQEETRDDADQYVCDHCGLAFDMETLEAEFLDPASETCSAACDNLWHGDNKLYPGIGFECHPCQLPTGHNLGHWTACNSKKLTATEAVR